MIEGSTPRLEVEGADGEGEDVEEDSEGNEDAEADGEIALQSKLIVMLIPEYKLSHEQATIENMKVLPEPNVMTLPDSVTLTAKTF